MTRKSLRVALAEFVGIDLSADQHAGLRVDIHHITGDGKEHTVRTVKARDLAKLLDEHAKELAHVDVCRMQQRIDRCQTESFARWQRIQELEAQMSPHETPTAETTSLTLHERLRRAAHDTVLHTTDTAIKHYDYNGVPPANLAAIERDLIAEATARLRQEIEHIKEVHAAAVAKHCQTINALNDLVVQARAENAALSRRIAQLEDRIVDLVAETEIMREEGREWADENAALKQAGNALRDNTKVLVDVSTEFCNSIGNLTDTQLTEKLGRKVSALLLALRTVATGWSLDAYNAATTPRAEETHDEDLDRPVADHERESQGDHHRQPKGTEEQGDTMARERLCPARRDRRIGSSEKSGGEEAVSDHNATINDAYAAYDADSRVGGPDGYEAFCDAVKSIWIEGYADGHSEGLRVGARNLRDLADSMTAPSPTAPLSREQWARIEAAWEAEDAPSPTDVVTDAMVNAYWGAAYGNPDGPSNDAVREEVRVGIAAARVVAPNETWGQAKRRLADWMSDYLLSSGMTDIKHPGHRAKLAWYLGCKETGTPIEDEYLVDPDPSPTDAAGEGSRDADDVSIELETVNARIFDIERWRTQATEYHAKLNGRIAALEQRATQAEQDPALKARPDAERIDDLVMRAAAANERLDMHMQALDVLGRRADDARKELASIRGGMAHDAIKREEQDERTAQVVGHIQDRLRRVEDRVELQLSKRIVALERIASARTEHIGRLSVRLERLEARGTTTQPVEVLAIVTNDNDDELDAMKLRSPEEVKTVIYGLIRAMAIAWPEEGGK